MDGKKIIMRYSQINETRSSTPAIPYYLHNPCVSSNCTIVLDSCRAAPPRRKSPPHQVGNRPADGLTARDLMSPAVVVGLPRLRVAETAQLHARKVPRVPGAVDVRRRDLYLQARRTRDLPGGVLDRVAVGVVDGRPPRGALRQDGGRRGLIGQRPAGRVLALPRPRRDGEAQALGHFERRSAADEDGGLEGRRRALGVRPGLVVQQLRGGERAALREGQDRVVRAGAGDQVGKPLARDVDLVGRVVLPEGVVWRGVEEVDAGRGRGGEGAVDKVELDVQALEQAAERCCVVCSAGRINGSILKASYWSAT